jgi:hypothetical protein
MADYTGRLSTLSSRSVKEFGSKARKSKTEDDGDIGAFVPKSDVEDKRQGAHFIPMIVTTDRREGKKVTFVTKCSPNCWYWQREDGSRIYHFDLSIYIKIGLENDPGWKREGHALAGPCPTCGNPHTNGGIVSAAEVAKLPPLNS